MSPLLQFVQQWFPGSAEVETPISVDVIRRHHDFDGFSDETIHAANFRGEPARTLSGINTPHIPSPVILHPPIYEDGTNRGFRNVGY